MLALQAKRVPNPDVHGSRRLATAADVFSWLFMTVWAAGLLTFPLLKGVLPGYVPVLIGLGAGVITLRSARPAQVFSWLARLSNGQFAVLVLGGAFLLRVTAIAVFPLEPRADDEQFHAYAISMLRGEGFGRPQFRAFFPPGMPLLLTAWYALTSASPWAGKVLQASISIGVVWQTWVTGRLIMPEAAARTAAVVVALLPTMVFYSASLGYEPLLALLLLLFVRLTLMLARVRRSFLLTLGLGLICGIATLVKPIGLLLPAIGGLTWLWIKVPLRRATGLALASVLMMAVVVAPWTWRNYQVLGAFVPVSTNGGVTLHAANNPRATGLFMGVRPLPGEVDEVSRDRIRFRAAVNWMLHNPGDWLRLAGVKNAYVWGTSSSIMAVVSTDRLPPRIEQGCQAILNVAWAWLFVVCLMATARYRPWSSAGFEPVTLLIAYIFLVHCFYEAHSRHHVSVVPLLSLIAAQMLVAIPQEHHRLRFPAGSSR